MKTSKIIIICIGLVMLLSLILCGTLNAQLSPIYTPAQPTIYGEKVKKLKPLEVLHLPVYTNDTLLHTNDSSAQIRVNDGRLQYHYGYWRDASSGGGGGTTGNFYQDMFSAIDSAYGTFERSDGRVDTIEVIGVGGGGGGSTPNLQTVTTVGNSSTNALQLIDGGSTITEVAAGLISTVNIGTNEKTYVTPYGFAIWNTVSQTVLNRVEASSDISLLLPNAINNSILAVGVTDGVTTQFAGSNGIIDISSFVGGGGGGSNFANADLTFDADHTHNLDGRTLIIADGTESVTDYTKFSIAHNNISLSATDATNDAQSVLFIDKDNIGLQSKGAASVTAPIATLGSQVASVQAFATTNSDSITVKTIETIGGDNTFMSVKQNAIYMGAKFEGNISPVNLYAYLPPTTTSNVVYYDETTGQFTYGAAGGGGGSPMRFAYPGEDVSTDLDREVALGNHNLVIRMDGNTGTSAGSYMEYSGIGSPSGHYLDIDFNDPSVATGNGTNIAHDGFHTYSFNNETGINTNFDVVYNRVTIQRNNGGFDNIKKDIVTSVEINGSEYFADSTGKVGLGTISGGGGGSSTRFGYSGEDDAASANRSFNLGAYKFDITGSGTNATTDRVMTMNYSGTHFNGSALKATAPNGGMAIDASSNNTAGISIKSTGYYALYAQGSGSGDAIFASAGNSSARGLQVTHSSSGTGNAVYISHNSTGGTSGVPLYIQQYGNGTSSTNDFMKVTTGVYNQLSSHSLNIRGTWSNSGAGDESDMFKIKINKTDVTNTLAANAEFQVATSNFVMTTALQIMSTGDVVFPGIRTFANDAAADADTTLVSTSAYLVTGSRLIHIKP